MTLVIKEAVLEMCDIVHEVDGTHLQVAASLQQHGECGYECDNNNVFDHVSQVKGLACMYLTYKMGGHEGECACMRACMREGMNNGGCVGECADSVWWCRRVSGHAGECE